MAATDPTDSIASTEAQSAATASPPQLSANFQNAHSSIPPLLITQGAEALLYKSAFLFPHIPCALKYRPSKPYRHPTLDARLTRHRILSEARVLTKCKREGVAVPAVYALDWEKGGGWMMMEWIEGDSVRKGLDLWLRGEKRLTSAAGEEDAAKQPQMRLKGLMERIGKAVGRMHEIGIVHGDLTTSNLMLRPLSSAAGETNTADGTLDGEIVLIDFGLAAQTMQDEDKAVDLYVLERAFGSTHPRAENLFQEVLKAYGASYKGAAVVLKRLEEVRMRGRKRSMIG